MSTLYPGVGTGRMGLEIGRSQERFLNIPISWDR